MEEWSKNILEAVESLADIVDEFFVECVEIIEEFTEEWQSTVGAEIDKCWQDLVVPIAEIYFDLEDIPSESDREFSYPVPPVLEIPLACRDCQHYHGQVYGGNLLVCAMHPYGWDNEHCPDWESIN